MNLARDIKDLAIAREALSRFPGTESESTRLEALMLDLMDKLEKELHPPLTYTPSKPDLEDEIPF